MKIKDFFLFGAAFISFHLTSAQTGFFLIVDNQKNCANLVTLMDSDQKYCVAPKPIIEESELSLASEIGYNLTETEKYFKVKLTDNGLSVLQLLCNNFSNKWVMVIGGRVVGTFRADEKSYSRIIIVRGKANSKELDSVFYKLKRR